MKTFTQSLTGFKMRITATEVLRLEHSGLMPNNIDEIDDLWRHFNILFIVINGETYSC